MTCDQKGKDGEGVQAVLRGCWGGSKSGVMDDDARQNAKKKKKKN